jgi:large conductance mechanosensitive channel
MEKTIKDKGRDFVDFVRQQGVIGLAVGLAIGAAAGETVKALVNGFINPIVGFLIGGTDLSNLSWHTGLYRGGQELIIGWGAALNSVIILLSVAFVVYFMVKGFRLDKLDKLDKPKAK